MISKKIYFTLFVWWVIISVACALFSAINILFNNIIMAIVFLCVSVACGFVTGIINEKYQSAKRFEEYMNKSIENFMELSKKVKIEPFEEFNVPFPEVKKKENNND